MSEAPEATRPPGVGAAEWISFELRMRQRRVTTCLQRAEQALEDGQISEARAALDEVLGLSPESPEAAALERRLMDVREDQTGSLPDAALPVSGGARRSRTRVVTAAVALLVGVGGGAALGAGYWYWTSGDRLPAQALAEPSSQPATVSHTAHAAPRERLTIVQETVRAKQSVPRLVADGPQMRAESEAPAATPPAEPARTEAPVVLAVNRTPAAPPPPGALDIRPEVQTAALPAHALAAPPRPAPPPPDPEPSARSEPSASSPDSGETRAREAPEAEAEPEVDESIVLNVLERYETAYSRLDADAASAVWPKVNRGALARAFDGLASQRVSLGSCEVAVDGPAARATCSGTATWEPKIGGGVRTEARRWNFELRKSGGAWRIERAIAH